MEAYFHNDPRIREWVDQITEKIFTVCLLTGADSDAEFQSGCQIVINLISLLQEIPTIPAEFLTDVVKQLFEQQLPDARVIDNFPTFKDTMDRMLREGLSRATDNPKQEAFNDLKVVEEIDSQIVEEIMSEFNDELLDNNIERIMEEASEEFVSEDVVAALATVNVVKHEPREAEFTGLTEEKVKVEVLTEIEDGAMKTDLLKRAINHVLPNSIVYWDKTIMGQTFLAQVEDILICLLDPSNPGIFRCFRDEGWKVLEYSIEDLNFPRRLERGLKQILRSSKKPSIV